MPSTDNFRLSIYSRNVYGTWRTYLADPKQAKAMHQLTGITTLTPAHQIALHTLGFTFEVIPDPEGQTKAA